MCAGEDVSIDPVERWKREADEQEARFERKRARDRREQQRDLRREAITALAARVERNEEGLVAALQAMTRMANNAADTIERLQNDVKVLCGRVVELEQRQTNLEARLASAEMKNIEMREALIERKVGLPSLRAVQ
ncbi:hypothetical protein [Bradyrhizobium sp. Arg816]|uniref:hypothetical protein n=1 Tax=Bradyrhizobium sp. Arg816 TaxID=2998491 RepID=UPI00249E6DB7|nr:hypothetical protein [Bradyrhizobium sp. Arg816]